LPKRGFKNPHRVVYEAINLDHLLAAFPGATEITLEAIYERGLCKSGAPLKVLSRGEVPGKISIEAHRFSAAAVEKITKAGGTAKALEG
jgi:large subunit ribosomal protein L15